MIGTNYWPVMDRIIHTLMNQFCPFPTFAVTNYYQFGPGSMKEYMHFEVGCQIMEEPVFDILRTKEQLGYSVFSMLRNTHGILGISVTVNSQVSVHEIDISNNFFTLFFARKIGFQV